MSGDIDTQPKTEEQIKEEIVDEYELDADDPRVDKIYKIKNDRFRATKKLKEIETKKPDDPKGDEGDDPKDDPSGEQPKVSPTDAARLQEAKIPVDDWNIVTEYAEFKGLTIAEAMKNTVVKASLAEKAEERKSAAATDTGRGKRKAQQKDGKALLNKFKETGEVPESDEDMDAMLEERYNPTDA